MRVIDVDSHYFEPPDWLSQVDPALAAEIPPFDPIERVVRFVAGDLLDVVPRDQLPEDLLNLLAPAGHRAFDEAQQRIADEKAAVDTSPPPMSYDAAARLAFNDAQGIDVQFINPTFAGNPIASASRANRPDLARRAIEAYNTWSSQTVKGHTDRLIPTTMLDVSDVEWAVRELTRMRAAGSRAFQVRAEPVGGTKSLAHPDLDPVWAAAADLEMAAVFHIGGARSDVDKGWYFNGGSPSHFALLHLVAGSMVPQVALAAMLIEGVFERHPGLLLIVEELGITWLPHFMTTIDSITTGPHGANFGMGPGDYKLPLKPTEYMRRQVRVTPLVSSDPLRPTFDLVPEELLVFSSDVPHPEGRDAAIAICEQQLDGVAAERRERFFGGEVAQLLGV
jgi:predicted TIM-barrel fold metal-dependent hydrolase